MPMADVSTAMAATSTSQNGMPFVESASFWANIAVVVFGALAAVAAGFALYFSSKLAAAKDAELNRFKTESAAMIASANARAAEANENAAKANEGTARALSDAASANERTRILEIEARKQRERAAKAENDLLELKSQLAWRTVNDHQAAALAGPLAEFRGSHLRIDAPQDNIEAAEFAQQLRTAFIKAGLDIGEIQSIFFRGGTTFSGLALQYGKERRDLANAIALSLVVSGLATAPVLSEEVENPTYTALIVGPKPQPKLN